MSRSIIEVPIKRRAHAVKEVHYKDPATGKLAIRGREWTDPETATTCKVEIYDANGSTIFAWTKKSGKPMAIASFKAADYLSRQSFVAKGVA